jgi:hypothetical protein
MTTRVRCAVYTRKSSEEGLEQSFNSLDAQREACEAYILSQRHEGWHVVSTRYDDGGFSGGNPRKLSDYGEYSRMSQNPSATKFSLENAASPNSLILWGFSRDCPKGRPRIVPVGAVGDQGRVCPSS